MQTTTKYVNSDTAAYRPEFAGDNRDQRGFLAWSSMWLNAARNAAVPGAVLASFIEAENNCARAIEARGQPCGDWLETGPPPAADADARRRNRPSP